MKQTAKELWQAFRRARDECRGLPAPQPPRAEHAARIAGLLRSVLPASLYACLLRHGNETAVAVVDAEDNPRPEWLMTASTRSSLREVVQVPRMKLVTAGIGPPPTTFGELAVGFPARRKMPAEAPEVIAALADILGMQWALRPPRAAAPEIDASTSARLCANELASPVIHEFNNFLNTAGLHMALLESEVPAQLRPDLTSIRKQADAVARLIKQFQKYRDECRAVLEPLDLNRALREAVQFWRTACATETEHQESATPSGAPRLTLDLSDGLPKIQGTEHDLHCLVQFLLNPAKQAGNDGVVQVQTRRALNDVQLSVVLSGQVPKADHLNELFTASAPPGASVEELQLAACKSIVRKLHGSIRAETRAGGTTAIVVQLPAVS